jgi:hypothetical protein
MADPGHHCSSQGMQTSGTPQALEEVTRRTVGRLWGMLDRADALRAVFMATSTAPLVEGSEDRR